MSCPIRTSSIVWAHANSVPTANSAWMRLHAATWGMNQATARLAGRPLFGCTATPGPALQGARRVEPGSLVNPDAKPFHQLASEPPGDERQADADDCKHESHRRGGGGSVEAQQPADRVQ